MVLMLSEPQTGPAPGPLAA